MREECEEEKEKKELKSRKAASFTLVLKGLCYHYAIFWKFSDAAP